MWPWHASTIYWVYSKVCQVVWLKKNTWKRSREAQGCKDKPIKPTGANGVPCPVPSWVSWGPATPWPEWDTSRWDHEKGSAQVTWQMGCKCLAGTRLYWGRTFWMRCLEEGKKCLMEGIKGYWGETSMGKQRGKTGLVACKRVLVSLCCWPCLCWPRQPLLSLH